MDSGSLAWVLTSAALVLFMTPGLALFYGGMDRSRSVLNMLMMNFWCILAVPVLWVTIGYTLAQNPFDNKLIGNLDAAFLNGIGILDDNGGAIATVAFLGMFAVITPALISGAVASRMKFSAWALFVPLWLILVLCPVFKVVFGGYFYQRGSLDFAGGTAIHVNAGIAALAVALVLGRRANWPRENSAPHSMPLVMLGTGILWFGWFGFNAGSALGATGQTAQAFINTFIAAAAGGLTWALVERVRDGHFTNLGAASGIVAGLVGITPAAGFVSGMAPIAIGALGRRRQLLRRQGEVPLRLRRLTGRRRRALRVRTRRIARRRPVRQPGVLRPRLRRRALLRRRVQPARRAAVRQRRRRCLLVRRSRWPSPSP